MSLQHKRQLLPFEFPPFGSRFRRGVLYIAWYFKNTDIRIPSLWVSIQERSAIHRLVFQEYQLSNSLPLGLDSRESGARYTFLTLFASHTCIGLPQLYTS